MQDRIHDLEVEIECLEDNNQQLEKDWDNLKSWIVTSFSEGITEIEMVLERMEQIENGETDD